MITGSVSTRRLVRGLGLAAAVALLAGCDAARSSTAIASPSAVASASPGATIVATSTPPASQGATVPPSAVADPVPIEVVEAGLTAFPGDAGGSVSYAAVLHNPNTDWMLQRAEVLVDFLDANGAFVGGEELLVTILPGQTTAISGQSAGAGAATQIVVQPPEDVTAFVRRAGGEGFDVLDVATEAGASTWLTTGTLVSRFGALQTFVQVFAVHRAGGLIVGGASGGIESIEPGASATFEIVDSSAYAAVEATGVYWQVTR